MGLPAKDAAGKADTKKAPTAKENKTDVKADATLKATDKDGNTNANPDAGAQAPATDKAPDSALKTKGTESHTDVEDVPAGELGTVVKDTEKAKQAREDAGKSADKTRGGKFDEKTGLQTLLNREANAYKIHQGNGSKSQQVI